MAGTGPAMTKIGSATPSRSHPKIPMLQIGLGDQLFRPAAPHRAAALDDVVAVRAAGGGLGGFFAPPEPIAPGLSHRQAMPEFPPGPARPPPRCLPQDQPARDDPHRAARPP